MNISRKETKSKNTQEYHTNLAASVGLVSPAVGLTVLTLRTLCVRRTNTPPRVRVTDVAGLVAHITFCNVTIIVKTRQILRYIEY